MFVVSLASMAYSDLERKDINGTQSPISPGEIGNYRINLTYQAQLNDIQYCI